MSPVTDIALGLLGVWSLVGFLVVPTIRRPESTVEAGAQLFLAGPFAWLCVAIMACGQLIENALKR